MGFLIAAIIIILILSLRISVRFGIDGINPDGEPMLWVGVGIIKIKLMPTKEKKLKLRDYELRRFRKRQAAEAEKQAEREAKEKAAAEVEAKKSESEKASLDKKTLAKRKKNTETRLGLREKTNIPELIEKLTRVLKVFLARLGKHLRVKARRIVIIIATGDAASTAILYGAVIGAVQNLFALFTSTGTLQTGRDTVMLVDTDFTSEKSRIDIDLTASFRLWQLFDTAIRAGIEFLKKPD